MQCLRIAFHEAKQKEKGIAKAAAAGTNSDRGRSRSPRRPLENGREITPLKGKLDKRHAKQVEPVTLGEQVKLEAEQFIARAKVARDFKTLSAATVLACHVKIQKRLKPENVQAALFLDEQAGEAGVQDSEKGTNMILALRPLMDKMESLSTLCTCLAAEPDKPAGTAARLHAALRTTMENDIDLCAYPMERLLKRAAIENLHKKSEDGNNVTEAATALIVSENNDEVSLSMVPEPVRMESQRRLVGDVVSSLMRLAAVENHVKAQSLIHAPSSGFSCHLISSIGSGWLNGFSSFKIPFTVCY
jgi:hypothetical protein